MSYMHVVLVILGFEKKVGRMRKLMGEYGLGSYWSLRQSRSRYSESTSDVVVRGC